jgi:DNA-3-methyladenine glycosylase I
MKEKQRCGWVRPGSLIYEQYHDEEWGVPVHNDRLHFEFIILEGAQAGLSWETILKRREGYRKAFAGFDPVKVARFGQKEVEELMQNEQIIRNRLKIEGAIINARCFLEIQKEFGSFDAYVWSFVGGSPLQNHRRSIKDIPAKTEEAEKLSKDLKKRGFKFVGPTIIYAHMQATGLVNDHTVDCFRHNQLIN